MQKGRLFNVAAAVGVLGCMAGLLLFPAPCALAARGGLAVCAQTLVPSLFPFLVLATVFIRTGLASYLGRPFEGLMRRLFWLPGSCAGVLLLGITAGYPVGAKAVTDMYRQGHCTAAQAKRMLCFCSNAGPAFVVSVAGAALFGRVEAGFWLLACQTAASFLCGAGLGLWARRHEHSPLRGRAACRRIEWKNAAPAMADAALAMVRVCGFAVFFAVFLALMEQTGLPAALTALAEKLGLFPHVAEGLEKGFWEVTAGLTALAQGNTSHPLALATAGLLLAWSGVSVHCQVLAYLGEAGLSARQYLLGKCACALLTGILAYLTGRFLAPVPHAPVFSLISGAPVWAAALHVSLLETAGLGMAGALFVKKSGKKTPSTCFSGADGV
ncbi:MAG: hypothetical protein IKD06_01210 [Clostridia bacterium]|nr:hypothetical protein [Clostridia bacterium]